MAEERGMPSRRALLRGSEEDTEYHSQVVEATPVQYVLNKKLRSVPIEILRAKLQRSEYLDRKWPILC